MAQQCAISNVKEVSHDHGDNSYSLESHHLAAVRGGDRHARQCPAGLPRRALERAPMERPLATTGVLGVLVYRLSLALLARPVPLRLGGRIRAARSVHP